MRWNASGETAKSRYTRRRLALLSATQRNANRASESFFQGLEARLEEEKRRDETEREERRSRRQEIYNDYGHRFLSAKICRISGLERVCLWCGCSRKKARDHWRKKMRFDHSFWVCGKMPLKLRLLLFSPGLREALIEFNAKRKGNR
jgi:hypothetical protein